MSLLLRDLQAQLCLTKNRPDIHEWTLVNVQNIGSRLFPEFVFHAAGDFLSQTSLQQQENVRNIHAKEIKCSYVMCLS